jgi:hypothetical protein
MASKRNLRRKACGSKARFPDQETATNALRSLRRRTSTSGVMAAYRCQFCSGFHFGHAPANVRQGIAATRRLAAFKETQGHP